MKHFRVSCIFLFVLLWTVYSVLSITGPAFAETCGYTWVSDTGVNSHGYYYKWTTTCTLSEHEELFRYINDNKHQVYIIHKGTVWTGVANSPRSHEQILSEEECSLIPIIGYAATCTKSGMSDGTKCAFCGHIFEEQQEIPIKGHTRVIDKYLAPTCTEDGHTVGVHCSECGLVIQAYEVLPATGHTVVDDPAVPPTCTDTGLTAGSHCSVCEATIVEQKVVPALGHTVVVDTPSVPVSCTEKGSAEVSHCSVCNAILSNGEEIPAKGHTYVIQPAVAPTCTEEGSTEGKHCSICNEVFSTVEEIPALGHKPVTDKAVPATCLQSGLTAGSHCSVCGEVFVQQKIVAPKGHIKVVDIEAIDATCTEEGNTEESHCSVCNAVLALSNSIPALTHDLVHHDAQAPTCTEVGWDAYDTCKREGCGYSTYVEIPALTHDLVHHEAKAATCTEIGWDAYDACKREGCNYTTYVEIPALTHDLVHHDAKAATCTEVGWDAYDTCKREGCGCTTYVEIPALNHDWNVPSYTWSDDNTSVKAAVTCKNNGDHTLTETVNTTSNQTKAPTYFAKGETTYTATFTNALFTEQTRVVDDIAIKEKDAEVKAVEAMITALNDDSTLSDKDNVNAAREAYQNLTDEQKQQQVGADMLAKLEKAEHQVQAAEEAARQAAEKQAADTTAATPVTQAIQNLPATAGVNDRAAVQAARAAYDSLTADQKTLVPADVVARLTTAEASVKAAEEAEAARKAKEETERKAKEEAERKAKEEAERKAKVEAERKAKEEAERKAKEEAERKAKEEAERKAKEEAERKAKEEAERKAKEEAERKAKEEAARKAAEEEAARKAAEEEAAKQAADETAAKLAADAIQALSDSVGLGDKEAVAAARAAYDALTEDQKKLIPGDVLSKLATAEQQVAAAEEAARTVDISACEIAVKDLAYTGKKVKKPTVTIRYGETQLTEGADYSFTYNTKAKAIGAYKLTVTGMGRYTGSVDVTFNVVPKGTAFSKVTGGDKQITLKWKSQKNITGYQIEYSLKKDFSGSKKVTVKKAKTLTTTIKKLKAGQAYYVRIRTYTTVKKKNYYSAWSKAKAVKTKAGKAKNESNAPAIGTGIEVGDLLFGIDDISGEEIILDDEETVVDVEVEVPVE